MVSLSDLPVEILYRIVTIGPCENALALLLVNHRFHMICTESKTYANIVKNGNGGSADHTTTSWWPSGTSDWSIAARWALADNKTHHVFRWEDNYPIPLPVTSLFWLPELLTQGHEAAVESLSDRNLNFRSNLDTEIVTRAVWHETCQSFYNHVRSLRYMILPSEVESTASSHTDPMSGHVPKSYSSILNSMVPDLRSSGMQSRSMFTSRAGNRAGPTTSTSRTRKALTEVEDYDMSCLTLATVMVATLNNSIKKNVRTVGDVAPPRFEDFPLSQIYQYINPPFSNRVGTDAETTGSVPFLKSHLPVTTSTAFLSSGEWIGYYCYSGWRANVSWDGMMSGIHLEVTADYQDHCAVSTRGKASDQWGLFMLFGTIHRNNGWIQMTKQYDSGTTWQWKGVMTSFGIVASWGPEDWGGWLWLWKREWSSSQP